MTKKDKTAFITGLKKLSQDIAEIAAVLEGTDAPPAKEEPALAPVQETPEKTWTLEEVRGIMADKARSGFRAEIKALLAAHGAEKLSDVTDPAELAAIAAEAEVIGNA